MRNIIRIAFFLSILATFRPALASDISILASPPGVDISSQTQEEIQRGSYLLFSGEIQKGDAEKLAKVLIQAHPFGTILYLDSLGGNVEEALRIASLAKALHLMTFVANSGTCASACFFIWLAGDMHFAVGTINGKMPTVGAGYIGLHRPYSKLDPAKRSGSSDAEARQHDVMQITSTYLRNEDVPQRLIDLMMSRPSNDIYWMTQDDIEQLGQYSPGREELLISRCGYNRKTDEDLGVALVVAKRNQDSATVARLTAQLQAEGACAATAFPDLKEETIKITERLRKGWRPWLKSKVAGKRQ